MTIEKIYPKTIKDFAIIKQQQYWPFKVYVLTPNDNLNTPLHERHTEPSNALEYADTQISNIQALQLWWFIHDKIITYLLSRNEWSGDRVLAYNTTWAFLGYIHNQCPNAIALARRIKRDRSFYSSALLLKDLL